MRPVIVEYRYIQWSSVWCMCVARSITLCRNVRKLAPLSLVPFANRDFDSFESLWHQIALFFENDKIANSPSFACKKSNSIFHSKQEDKKTQKGNKKKKIKRIEMTKWHCVRLLMNGKDSYKQPVNGVFHAKCAHSRTVTASASWLTTTKPAPVL